MALFSQSVYILYSKNLAVLYVGITRHISSRLTQHSNTQPWWPDVASAKFEHYDTEREARDRELELIRSLRPQHNHWPQLKPREQRQ